MPKSSAATLRLKSDVAKGLYKPIITRSFSFGPTFVLVHVLVLVYALQNWALSYFEMINPNVLSYLPFSNSAIRDAVRQTLRSPYNQFVCSEDAVQIVRLRHEGFVHLYPRGWRTDIGTCWKTRDDAFFHIQHIHPNIETVP